MNSPLKAPRPSDQVALLMAAACAIGVVLFIDRYNGFYFFTPVPKNFFGIMNPGPRRPFELSQLGYYVETLAEELSFGATIPTVVMLVLRLRKPRPSLRRLFFQPGVSALCAILVVHCLLLALRCARWCFRAEESLADACWSYLISDFRTATIASGIGVVMVWFNLRISGRWRPEASWLDRAGIALGVYWICAAAVIGWRCRGFGLY